MSLNNNIIKLLAFVFNNHCVYCEVGSDCLCVVYAEVLMYI